MVFSKLTNILLPVAKLLPSRKHWMAYAKLPSIAFRATVTSVSLNGMGKYGRSRDAVNWTIRLISSTGPGRGIRLESKSDIRPASARQEYGEFAMAEEEQM